MRLADFAPRLARARDQHESRAWRLGYCAQGCHDSELNGRCYTCGDLCGSTLDMEPYDFSSARRELAAIHAYVRRHGLDQAYGDGQWGYTSGYYEPEWTEVGNTIQALAWVARIEAEDSWWRGVEHFDPAITKLPAADEMAEHLVAQGMDRERAARALVLQAAGVGAMAAIDAEGEGGDA